MKIIRLGGLALVGSLGLAAATPAAAITTTLDFAGNICGVAGNQACGNGSQIGQNYGDGTGVDVSYRSYLQSNGTTSEAYLKHWASGYGDLQNVVWGGFDPTNYGAEIRFMPLAGYELRLLGFDAGCYLNRASCRSFNFAISGGHSANGTATPAANSHDSFAFNFNYTASTVILRWGPDAFDGGLDNIAFDVRRIAVGGIPEPTTWALLIMGFGFVGGAMRKRSSKLAFA